VAAKDAALIAAVARAYGAEPAPSEGVDARARRVLRARDPRHPAVEDGSWLVALMRRFYLDVAARADRLARLEQDRHRRRWLEARGAEAQAAADTLGRELRVELDGIEGAVALPPRVGGDPPTRRGAKAELVGGRLVIERLPRADFRSGPPEGPRTRGGALREVYSALRQYDTTARMLGRYDASWRKKRGHVQVILPAVAPALVLDEIARAAREANARVLHLVTLDGDGEVRELPLHLRGAGEEAKRVTCDREAQMDACAERLAHAHAQGRVVYRPKGQ
jgi:hypothetical protein